MSDCAKCIYLSNENDEEPCSSCKSLGNGKKDKFKPAPHTDDPCEDCYYDYRTYRGAEKDKAMMCGSCHRHLTRVNYITEAIPFNCLNCKHKLKDVFTSCTVCNECDRYSNYEAELPNDIEDDIEQEEIKSVSDDLVKAVKDFTFAFSPCKICRYNSEDSEHCQRCCYNYPSEFTLRGVK